ncbi:transforming growth factor beta regulator 1 isoform 2 [Bos taurus]|uniref:Transforming growth factor beta regulator 1 n=1 Tax=Bos taurus TaxID=9913 RepID=Q0V8K6_BOVIN|nr:transforming growth factor beta regulator 1 [Bos taurus]ABG67051.1 transforming growth factor beta regulator 1 [Bos taurus]DAA13900.1 TPA: transforming growth factor beta regulator 1 [Bos taurus]
MTRLPSTPWAIAALGSMPACGVRTRSVCTPVRSRMVARSLSLKLFLKTTPRMLSSAPPLMPVMQSCSRPSARLSIHNLIQSCPGARKCVNYQWVKFDVCKPGDSPPPQEQLENDIATSFEAFQRHTFDEDHSDPILQGSLDLPELQPTAFVSSYQPMFLTHEPLVDAHLQHLKSPSPCSPSQSSD